MKTNSFLLSAIIFLGLHQPLFADEISVVDVKRNITMSDEELIYKDFYLNAGEGSGLKRNLVVNVKRKIQVRDVSSKSMGEFETLVGQLKIVQVSDKVAVGREFKLFPRDEEAMLDQVGIMAGDRIDLAGSFIDTSKPKRATASTDQNPLGLEQLVQPTSTVLSPTTSVPKQIPATAAKIAAPTQERTTAIPANASVPPLLPATAVDSKVANNSIATPTLPVATAQPVPTDASIQSSTESSRKPTSAK